MEIQLRKATHADAPAIRELEKELIVYERKLAPSLKQEEEINYYDIPLIISDDERSLLVVLEDDGKVIGCGFGQLRSNENYYRENTFGYIGLMSVSENYRGKGYGGMIIDALFDFFREKNIKEVKLKVFSNNDGAIRSYKKMGFKDHMTEMKCSL